MLAGRGAARSSANTSASEPPSRCVWPGVICNRRRSTPALPVSARSMGGLRAPHPRNIGCRLSNRVPQRAVLR